MISRDQVNDTRKITCINNIQHNLEIVDGSNLAYSQEVTSYIESVD